MLDSPFQVDTQQFHYYELLDRIVRMSQNTTSIHIIINKLKHFVDLCSEKKKNKQTN